MNAKWLILREKGFFFLGMRLHDKFESDIQDVKDKVLWI